MNAWGAFDSRLHDLEEQLAQNAVLLAHQARSGVFHFQPFSDKQKRILNWWCDESPVKDYQGIIADGSIRSGKTLSMSLSFCLWAMHRFSGQNFAVCGKTIGSLRRNVIFWLKLMLRSRGYTVMERRADNLILVRRANTLNYFYLFGGKDERSQDLIQGITLAGVLFDEVALMPESFVNQATARCSVDGSKWWFNCNPDGPFHWFFVEWIKKCRRKGLLYLHFTMDDNLSLSEPIKERYRRQYTGVFYERFILGHWVVAEGLVYALVAEHPERYILHELPFNDGQFYISIDYGTVNPCSMGLWCVNGRRAVRVKEWYFDSRRAQRQMTDEEYYARLEELASGYYIQKVIVDPSAASFIETIRRHRKFLVREAENDVVNGIRVTASLLAAGMVQVMDVCRDCRREFGLYRWADEKLDRDTVIKENDHAMDDLRYFCATILSREFRWVDWRKR